MKLVNIHKHLLFILLVLIASLKADAQVWDIQQCIDTAQANNKKLKMGRNNQASADEKWKEAKANLMPKANINADYKYFTNLPYQLMPLSTFNPAALEGQFKEAQFGVPHNINTNLQLSMPLYNVNTQASIKITKIASDLSELQYKKTEEQIFFEIANLYYNAQIFYHQLSFIDSNLINAERLLKNMQLLHNQLLAKGTDVSKVKLQIAQLNTQKENIKVNYEQVLNELKLTMGIPTNKLIKIDHEIVKKSSTEYTNHSSLDAQLLKTQNRILKSELNSLNKSRFLPSINLVGMYGSTGFGYDKKPNDFLKFYPIGFAGIQLNYSLFNGLATNRKMNQKKYEIQNNVLQLELIDEQNNVAIENAKLQMRVAEKSIETSEIQIDLAKTIYEQTILQQKQGIMSITEVLLADNAVREAQQIYLSAIIDYLKADLKLKKITGNISTTK